jgi:hypothetical protein
MNSPPMDQRKVTQITVERLQNEDRGSAPSCDGQRPDQRRGRGDKEKGIFSGKRIERAEIGAPGEFETMTDDELERALMERMARLGLTDVGETQH